MTPAHLEKLATVLTRRSGFSVPETRWPFLRTRARAAMHRAGITSADHWVAELESSAAGDGRLWAAFEDALQIHETSFFRYDGHHRLLAELVVPELAWAVGHDRGGTLRVLSVGCATGEEAYSIAMTIAEQGGPAAAAEILAVDVAAAALAVALRGVYSAAAIQAVPPAYRRRYFAADGDDWAVTPALRRPLRFVRHDIRRDFYLGKFDVVFCCNVLLYFTPAVKQWVLGRLAGALRRGGFLFVGHAEGVTPPTELFRCRQHAAGIVYQRI